MDESIIAHQDDDDVVANQLPTAGESLEESSAEKAKESSNDSNTAAKFEGDPSSNQDGVTYARVEGDENQNSGPSSNRDDSGNNNSNNGGGEVSQNGQKGNPDNNGADDGSEGDKDDDDGDGDDDEEDPIIDGDDEDGGDDGGGGKQNKKDKESSKSITRIRYSNDFKVKILNELEVSNVTVAEMARRHKLPEATLRDWVKTKDKITTAQVNRRGSAKSNSRDNLQKVTDALRTFMDLNDRLGACGMSKLPITNAMIAKQGQEVKGLLLEKDAKKPFLTPQERKTLNAFNASIWWSKKWARKHNLHSVGHGEAAKAAAALSSMVPEIRKEYSKDHVFFVVDTMLFHKVLPTRSYAEKASGSGGKKYLDLLKDRLSLFICANSSGSHKVPLTMISDKKDPPSFVANRQKVFPYLYQEKAWADPKSLLSWWKDVFLPDIREWTDEKVLLVLQKPSIVDLEDPQDQASVKFLPPLLANNHNSSADGLSVSSFFEPPISMLSVVKTKYRYELLREVLQIYEEREPRREVATKAMFPKPGLKQGYLPHLQDCMRILNDVWTKLPASAIGSSDEDGDGKKKKRRKRRKKKGTSENDIIENEAMVFSDELGTDELIKEIIHFFRKNDVPTEDVEDLNPLDKSVAEVKRCFLNDKLLLKSNQEQLTKVLENWIGLEESQEIRTMLQTEILAGMKFRLIIGVDDVDEGDTNPSNNSKGGQASQDEKEVNDDVALDCATQLLECAVRLSTENSAFHDLASKLIEASDAAFVALRQAKLPPEKREAPAPKKRKNGTISRPRKKRAKVIDAKAKVDDDKGESKEEPVENVKISDGDAEIAPMVEAALLEPEGRSETNDLAEEEEDAEDSDYDGAVFEI